MSFSAWSDRSQKVEGRGRKTRDYFGASEVIAKPCSHQRVKDGEADNDDGVGEKIDSEELMIALIARDGGDRQAGKLQCGADVISQALLEKMWNAFEQRVHDIHRHEESEENKETAVIRVVMLFVIDEFIDRDLG